MTAKELKKRYLDFFVKKGHKIIPNVSLVPENDPTTLFISAGMHPLVPYLLGEPHPLGKRLVSLQRCLRTSDIDEVGNVTHNSFFEMLGNWSLGDYWKKEAIEWSFEFLTKELKIPAEKLYVTCFVGDQDAPKDEESASFWRSLGIPSSRIFFLSKEDNWWGPAGQTGPCGPDTEMFIDTGKKPCQKKCQPGCSCGKYFEVWNDVFMQYEKKLKTQNSKLKTDGSNYKDYEFIPLKQKNVDTGMGVERTVAVLSGLDDDYQTELFSPIIRIIEEISGKRYQENQKEFRIIADHLRAATFAIADGVVPGKVEQGYVLRRLIRRTIDQETKLGFTNNFKPLLEEIINIYKDDYPELDKNKDNIYKIFGEEKTKYSQIITKTLRYEVKAKGKKISGEEAFNLYATHGLSPQQLRDQGYEFPQEEFDKAFKKHQEISRAGAEKKFAGGLADHSETVTKYHTATHLLNAALRQILGPHVFQKGSNITAERLRFDFPNPRKLTEEELKNTEELVNQKIKENLPVKMEMMTLEEAKKRGAAAVFGEKYGGKVKVYSIDPSTSPSTTSPSTVSSGLSNRSGPSGSGQPFSVEVCGGPHVDFTGKLGKFKIRKEEAVGAGVRRLYAVLE